jgi:hypothetical protein
MDAAGQLQSGGGAVGYDFRQAAGRAFGYLLFGSALSVLANPELTPNAWVDVGPAQVSFGNDVFTQGLASTRTIPQRSIFACRRSMSRRPGCSRPPTAGRAGFGSAGSAPGPNAPTPSMSPSASALIRTTRSTCTLSTVCGGVAAGSGHRPTEAPTSISLRATPTGS